MERDCKTKAISDLAFFYGLDFHSSENNDRFVTNMYNIE